MFLAVSQRSAWAAQHESGRRVVGRRECEGEVGDTGIDQVMDRRGVVDACGDRVVIFEAGVSNKLAAVDAAEMSDQGDAVSIGLLDRVDAEGHQLGGPVSMDHATLDHHLVAVRQAAGRCRQKERLGQGQVTAATLGGGAVERHAAGDHSKIGEASDGLAVLQDVDLDGDLVRGRDDGVEGGRTGLHQLIPSSGGLATSVRASVHRRLVDSLPIVTLVSCRLPGATYRLPQP